MAGYSGTPLAKKLGIKAKFKVALPNLPAEIGHELDPALAACEMGQRRLLDFVAIFVTREEDLKASFSRWSRKLAPAGMLWIAWPKKSSGVKTDLDENKVRQIGLAAGMVDVKVCAISDVWSGLKFVTPVEDRPLVRGRRP